MQRGARPAGGLVHRGIAGAHGVPDLTLQEGRHRMNIHLASIYS